MRNRRGIRGRVYSGGGDGMIVVDDEPWWGRMSMGIGVAVAVAVFGVIFTVRRIRV